MATVHTDSKFSLTKIQSEDGEWIEYVAHINKWKINFKRKSTISLYDSWFILLGKRKIGHDPRMNYCKWFESTDDAIKASVSLFEGKELKQYIRDYFSSIIQSTRNKYERQTVVLVLIEEDQFAQQKRKYSREVTKEAANRVSELFNDNGGPIMFGACTSETTYRAERRIALDPPSSPIIEKKKRRSTKKRLPFGIAMPILPTPEKLKKELESNPLLDGYSIYEREGQLQWEIQVKSPTNSKNYRGRIFKLQNILENTGFLPLENDTRVELELFLALYGDTGKVDGSSMHFGYIRLLDPARKVLGPRGCSKLHEWYKLYGNDYCVKNITEIRNEEIVSIQKIVFSHAECPFAIRIRYIAGINIQLLH